MILLVIHKTFPAFFGLSGHFPLFPNIDRDAVHRTETVPRSVYTNTGNNQGDDQVKVKPGWLDNSCYNAGAWTEGQAGGVSGRYCNGGKAQWLNPGKERERSWRGGGLNCITSQIDDIGQKAFPCFAVCNLWQVYKMFNHTLLWSFTLTLYRNIIFFLVSSECVYNLLIHDCHGWPKKIIQSLCMHMTCVYRSSSIISLIILMCKICHLGHLLR